MAGYALQNILSRSYFAKQDGRAPLIAGGVSILANLLLCMVLAGPLGVAGLAMASAASSTLYALLLLIPLERRGEGVLTGAFLLDLGKMLLATLGMAAAVWLAGRALGGLLPGGKLGELLLLGLCAGIGMAVYFLLSALLRLEEMELARAFLRRKP